MMLSITQLRALDYARRAVDGRVCFGNGQPFSTATMNVLVRSGKIRVVLANRTYAERINGRWRGGLYHVCEIVERGAGNE